MKYLKCLYQLLHRVFPYHIRIIYTLYDYMYDKSVRFSSREIINSARSLHFRRNSSEIHVVPVLDLQLPCPFFTGRNCIMRGSARVPAAGASTRDRCVTQSHPLRLLRLPAPCSLDIISRGFYYRRPGSAFSLLPFLPRPFFRALEIR
jgi:hypothetical protein